MWLRKRKEREVVAVVDLSKKIEEGRRKRKGQNGERKKKHLIKKNWDTCRRGD